MTTQPNSGEEKAVDQIGILIRWLHDRGQITYSELVSQLRAERDFYRTKVEQVQQTALELSEERDTYRAERDRLKEELDKGKSAMKTMSELFSVTSQKCGTLESDNARLAAEVEKFKGMCVEATDKIYEQVQTISRLTAELEAKKGEAKEFSAKAIEFGNVAMTRGDQAIQFQAERDALAAQVRELRKYGRHYATCDKLAFALSKCSCGLDALLSTPPDEVAMPTADQWCKVCDRDKAADCLCQKQCPGCGSRNFRREIVETCTCQDCPRQWSNFDTPPDEGEKPQCNCTPGYSSECPAHDRHAREQWYKAKASKSPPPIPEGAGEKPRVMVFGDGFSAKVVRPDDTQGDERDQCLCPECCPTTQGEKEYRMLEEDERIQSIDEHDFSGGWKQAPSSAWGQKLHAQCVGHYRRPITPPTGGVE